MSDQPASSGASVSLGQFFEAIDPFLRRVEGADAVEARLGPCTSGRARLAVYPRLVGSAAHKILEDMFPSVRAASELTRPGLWCALVEEYYAAQPPAHWQLNRFGAAFADFLGAKAARDSGIPTSLEELADFHHARFAAATSLAPRGTQQLDATLFVRQYTHAIPAFVGRVAAEEAAGLPVAGPTVVVIYRSLHDGRPRSIQPGVAALVALAARLGLPGFDARSFPHITGDMVLVAEEELVERGVLGPSPARP